MAQEHLTDLNDFSPSYVYSVSKIRGNLLKILDNTIYFCAGGDRGNIARML